MRKHSNLRTLLLTLGLTVGSSTFVAAQQPQNDQDKSIKTPSKPVQSQTDPVPSPTTPGADHAGQAAQRPEDGLHRDRLKTPTGTPDQALESTRSRTADSTSQDAMVGETDKRFMTLAAEGGMMEVQLAQTAQQKGSSQSVKDLAKKIEEDHSKANGKLMEIAKHKGVTLPSSMGPKHQAMMDKVSGMTGEKFDRAYLKAMMSDHKRDIRLFEKQMVSGMDSDVKTFATETLPTLKEHQRLVQEVSANRMSSKQTSGSETGTDTTKPKS